MAVTARGIPTGGPEPPVVADETTAVLLEDKGTLPGWRRTFTSLQYRNYRLIWIGQLISSSGDWMDQIALNWLVFTLTDSAIWLAVLNLTRMGPMMVFALVAGVAADRYDRRRILMIANSFSMVFALALGVLVIAGAVEVWQVLLLGTLRGVANSFNLPTKQSLITDSVPPTALTNAVALNSAVLNTTRLVGPAIGGVLIATVGVGIVFLLNGLSFIGVLIALSLMVVPQGRPRVLESPLRSMGAGFAYVKQHREIAALLVLALVPVTLALPYQSLLAVFARDVLGIGAVGLGILTSASGLGALCGGLAVATLGEANHRGKSMIVAVCVMGLALSLFALSPWPLLSVALVFLVGAGQSVYMTSNNALLQSLTPAPMRGRVISILFLNRGLVPAGTMLAGVGIALIGAPLAIAAMGAMVVGCSLLVVWRAPAIAKLE